MSYLGNLPLKSLSNPLYHASSHEKLKEIQINEGLKENGDEQKMLSNVILRKVKKKNSYQLKLPWLWMLFILYLNQAM